MNRLIPIGFRFAATFWLLAAIGSADELSSLLNMPVSPASIAVLAPFARDHRVVARWKEALANQDSAVRAVAARAITTCGISAVLPAVEAALQKENDLDAAREASRCLILLGDPAAETVALASAARFGGVLDGDIALAFARARGTAALPLYFAKLRGLGLTPADRDAFFQIASRNGSETLTGAAAMALGRDDCPAFRSVLKHASSDTALMTSPVLVSALRSPNGEIRGEAAWTLALRYATTAPSEPASVLESLRLGESADPNRNPKPEMVYGAELLRRVLGETPLEHDLWPLALPPRGDSHFGRDLTALTRYLTAAERNAVAKRPDAPAQPSRKPVTAPSNRWSVSAMPKGLGADLLRTIPCGGATLGGDAVAEVAFRVDGRPALISLRAAPTQRSCAQIVSALFMLSLAPEHQPTAESTPLTLEIPLIPDALSCIDEVPRDRSEFDPAADAGSFVPAKEVSRKEAIVPATSIWNQDAGHGELRGIISPTGCVTALHVTKTTGAPLVDSGMILRILQWKYAPATLNGRPIRSFLRITVGSDN